MDALEHVARMTRSRDRVLIDTTLVSSLLDLLPELSQVTLWRIVAEQDEQRWLPVVHQSRGDLIAFDESLQPQWSELASLDSMPIHARVLTARQIVREQVTDEDSGQPVELCVMPMPDDHAVQGVIELRSVQPLDDQHEVLVRGVLRIVHNFQVLLDDSERDTLTGLLNRKSFDETFLKATVFEATRQFGTSSDRRRQVSQRHWLGVVDIDHFKQVNDLYGHLIGDEVLVLMARIMRSTFRYHDRAYRFGGEEFVLLLTAPNEQAAGAAFERLRHNVEHFAFPRVGRVTASIGFSDVRPGDTPQAAFDRADRATYYAKQHGRNQVHYYDVLVESGALESGPSVGEIELF